MAKRKVNRSNLVRDTLTKGITKPADIVASIQQEHGVTVSTALIHKIKSTEGKTKHRKKPGPKPRAAASSNGSAATLSIQDITTVRGLLARLGREGVRELIAVLA